MTQKEIAKTLNLSISTVSRALKGSELISGETTEKVRKLANLTNYRPNPAARNLLTGKTFTAGIVFPFDDFFYRDLACRISSGLLKHDYMSLVLPCKTEEEFSEAIEKMLERRVDGIISSTVSMELGLKLKNEGLASIFYGNQAQPFDCVYVDKYKGGRISTEYVIKQGHKKIGYIGFNYRDDREKAFVDVLNKKGITVNEKWISKGTVSLENSSRAVSEILSLRDKPTAFIAHNDIAAIATIKSAVEKGFKVPDDIAVIGFNNIDISEYSNPPLTTIDQKINTISEELINCFIHRMNSKDDDYRKVRIEPELIIRRSC
ncbi:MAG: hypothetical protein A2017_22225 [Lentisphaerae bacterium GWF2_44_16]|nr:MAG: hypothetical protein A2017_22225 [Lentisphaerae bacterium GWF2_44_16]